MFFLNRHVIKEAAFTFFTYMILVIFAYHALHIESNIALLNNLSPLSVVFGLILITRYSRRGEKALTKKAYSILYFISALMGLAIYFALTS